MNFYKSLLIHNFLIISTLGAMEKEKGIMSNHYFYNLEDSNDCDDVKKNAKIKLPLFMQACVQAAQVTGHRGAAFNELLTKIKSNNISINNSAAYITEKDLKHRLLTCIPEGSDNYCVINGKITRLIMVLCETKADKEENEVLRQMAQVTLKNNPTAVSKGVGKEVWPGYHPVDVKVSGIKLKSLDHSFESDVNHHASIIEEFKRLTQVSIKQLNQKYSKRKAAAIASKKISQYQSTNRPTKTSRIEHTNDGAIVHLETDTPKTKKPRSGEPETFYDEKTGTEMAFYEDEKE